MKISDEINKKKTVQRSPLISAFSAFNPISKKRGRVGRPRIFVMLPQIGTINPAPADTKISFTTSLKPTGVPLIFGSAVNDTDVFAIQIGRLP